MHPPGRVDGGAGTSVGFVLEPLKYDVFPGQDYISL